MPFVNIQKMKIGSYVTVKVTDNFIENGKNLLLAYQEAKNLNPGGSNKSSTNRVTLLIPPGNYNLNSSPLSIDISYLDVIALESGQKNPSVLIVNGGVTVSSSDCRIIGIKSDSFAIGISNSNQYFENCAGGLNAFGGSGGTASGTFVNCVGGDNSFAGEGGLASGNFINCKGGIFAFGGGGVASGYFKDCEADHSSFGGFGGSASGTFLNCTCLGDYGFGGGGIAGGIFKNCTSSNYSFGGQGGLAGGSFYNCKGLNSSFGGSEETSNAVGFFENCFGLDYCFRGSAQVINCRASSFFPLSAPAESKALYVNCIDNNGNIINGEA